MRACVCQRASYAHTLPNHQSAVLLCRIGDGVCGVASPVRFHSIRFRNPQAGLFRCFALPGCDRDTAAIASTEPAARWSSVVARLALGVIKRFGSSDDGFFVRNGGYICVCERGWSGATENLTFPPDPAASDCGAESPFPLTGFAGRPNTLPLAYSFSLSVCV